MNYFEIVILSLVEGITEFLPISSTGHLILTSNLLQIEQTEFLKSFEVIIQLGAILAVVVLYFDKLLKNVDIWKKIFVAFLPTAIVGLIFYPLIKSVLIGNTLITLISLFLGGIFLIFFELKHKENETNLSEIKDMSYKQALMVGLAQSFAVIPGVSRSAATIIGGLSFGFSRSLATEFSFLLAIPTMFAATLLDLIKNDFSFTGYEINILANGFLISFFTALFSIKFLLKFVKNNTFIPFGIYRILLAILYILFI